MNNQRSLAMLDADFLLDFFARKVIKLPHLNIALFVLSGMKNRWKGIRQFRADPTRVLMVAGPSGEKEVMHLAPT
jgi:hypothetical protein